MEVKLAAGEPFDNEHDLGACWAAPAGWLGQIDTGRHAEQSAAAFERSTTSAVGEQTEMPESAVAAGPLGRLRFTLEQPRSLFGPGSPRRADGDAFLRSIIRVEAGVAQW